MRSGIPKRSLNGVETNPERVVAPIRVNGCKSILTERAMENGLYEAKNYGLKLLKKLEESTIEDSDQRMVKDWSTYFGKRKIFLY